MRARFGPPVPNAPLGQQTSRPPPISPTRCLLLDLPAAMSPQVKNLLHRNTQSHKNSTQFFSFFSLSLCGERFHLVSRGTRSPRRILAALTVLYISIAIVRGPTPPGPGVKAPATSATSGCTSPTRVEPFVRNVSSRFVFPANRR